MEATELVGYYRRPAAECEAIYAKPERQDRSGGWPGARVLLLDNRYIAGNSTPIAQTDAAGNTYQDRRLADGSVTRIVKNFPTVDEVRRSTGGEVVYRELDYYWLAEYQR